MKSILLVALLAAASASALEFTVTTASTSVEGRIRNEQVLLSKAKNLYVLADGLDGHTAAAEAATLTISGIERRFSKPSARALLSAVAETSREIHSLAQEDPKMKGMGATLVSAWLDGSRAHVVHAGALRAYRLRKGKLTQLTKDHSLLNDYLKTRKLTPEEIRDFPMKHVVVRALGVRKDIEPELTKVDLKAGDLLLLTSDEANRMFSLESLEELLSGPAPTAQALVTARPETIRGLTVILIKVSK